MKHVCFGLTVVLATLATASFAQDGHYKVVKTVKTGGDGGFDYIYADSANRRLYVPRTGPSARISVFNLDTLAPVGEIAKTNARGAAVDVKSGHGFSSSKPVAMWDAKTLAPIKTIDVQGSPDGIMSDPSTQRIYVLSHASPNLTAIDAKDGSVIGTVDLGGAPEQAVTDGKGHLYIDIEDKDNIAVVDTKAMHVTGHYDISAKGGTCAGLAMDVKHGILFATCRKPQMMVILKAADGQIIDALPIGAGTDGAIFNPATKEAFSSQGDGSLTVVKEKSPTSFVVEQNVTTPARAKTLTLDRKTGHILLMTAEFGPAPVVAAGARPQRPPMLPDSFSLIEVGTK
jgi:DNA-binding beta-propeller fold protein YncE